MIEIERTKAEITVKGHAHYGPYGKDIVCAGVSALVNGLIASVKKLTPNSPACELRDGYAHVKVGSPTMQTELLFDCFVVSAKDIADEFPDYVRVTEH